SIEYVRTPRAMGSPPYAAIGIAKGMGSGVWIGDTKQPRLEFWTNDGLTRVVQWAADTVLMTSQRMSEYLDTVAASVPAEASVALRQQLSEFPAVDRLPSWEEMIVARNGKIWLSADVTMRLPPEL